MTAATGLLALADDSGIEVDAFDGRPGVLSARYGGEGLTDLERNALMLRELAGVPAARRTARYRAVIAVTAPDGREVTMEGTVEGVVLEAPRGDGRIRLRPALLLPAARRHLRGDLGGGEARGQPSRPRDGPGARATPALGGLIYC